MIRLLSPSWLNAGIRLWGENAASLSLAIGGAVGLEWLRVNGHQDYLDKAIATLEAASASAATSGERTIEAIARDIQLAVFPSLREARFRRALGEFFRANWGTYVPQDQLIALLRGNGAKVPHVFG